jgi:hypothetical protein
VAHRRSGWRHDAVHTPITILAKPQLERSRGIFDREHVHEATTPVHGPPRAPGQASTHRSRKAITTTLHVPHCPFRGRGTNGTKKQKERIDPEFRAAGPAPRHGWSAATYRDPLVELWSRSWGERVRRPRMRRRLCLRLLHCRFLKRLRDALHYFPAL